MIIERLDLKAFGLFTDVSIDLSAGPRRFHLVYGPNESGKSTSLRAITSLLFGMPHVTDDNYVHANTQMRVGGRLVDRTGDTLECVRRRGRKGTLRDADDQELIDETSLQDLLGGVDRETFLSRFGLSHDELTAGGAAILRGDGDLGEILFAAGAGVGKLREIQDELDQASQKLFTPRGNKSINVAVKQLDEKRKELRQAQLPPAEYLALGQKIKDHESRSRDLEESLTTCASQLARLKSYQQAAPLVPRWRSDIETLGTLLQTPTLDEAFTQRRREAESDQKLTETQRAELNERIEELVRRADALPADDAVITHQAEIQTLFQELAARDKADRDRIDLIRVQGNTDRKIADLLKDLSVSLLTEDEDERTELIEDSVNRFRVSDSLRTHVHELAAKHERLIQQRDDARDEVQATKKRLADVNDQLDRFGNPPDPASLAGVMDSVGSPAPLLETLAQQQDQSEQCVRQCESLAQRLDGFQGDYRLAAGLKIPTQSEVDHASRRSGAAEAALESLRSRRETLGREYDHANDELRRQQSGEPLPTAEQLLDARRQRDEAIAGLAEQAEPSIDLGAFAAGLRELIGNADQIVDTMRTHHQEVHARSMQLERIRSIEQELGRCDDEIELATKELSQAHREWTEMWHLCGVVADSPERMKQWLVDHQQLVQAVARLEESQQRLQQSQRRVDSARHRLSAAIESVVSGHGVYLNATAGVAESTTQRTEGGMKSVPGPDVRTGAPDRDLESLHDEAVVLRGELTRLHGQHETLCRRRDELAEELPVAETRFETHQRAVTQWEQEWRRVTERLADSEDATPTVVMSALRRIDQLCEKKRERDILATRIRSIGEDDLSFASRAKRLADLIGGDGADLNEPGAIIQSLYQRLQNERAASKQRDVLIEQIDRSKRRLGELNEARAACGVVLGQLCEEARCESPKELPEIEAKSRQREKIDASRRELESQLRLLAGKESIESFVESVAEQEPAMLALEIDRAESELERIRDSISSIDQEIGALRHEMGAIDGGGHASDLSQSIQLLAGAIHRDVEEFARLRTASLLLRKAIDHYRRENQSPVLSMAEAVFGKLTCGEYESLKVDFDAKGKSILYGVRRGEGVVDVPAPSMSTGTADALYLALRLASLEHQLAHGPAIPLIVDDCLIQLDDDRCVAAMKALSDLSTRTQVILFTHHQHLIDLAAAHLDPDDFHVHRL